MQNALGKSAATLAILVLATAALALGRPLLMPLALSLLLTFWLAPLVSRVERAGAPRVVAVVFVVLLLGVAAGALGWVASRQLTEVSARLPELRRNVVLKVRDLRGPIGSLARASSVLEELGRELEPPTPRGDAPAQVEVVERPTPVQTIAELVAPLLTPLATAAAVAVLTLFMLLQREELRDRAIRLAGTGDLTRTTHAFDDAAARLSRFLGAQSLLCAAHGAMVTVGLAVLGIPGALLWGVLGGLLRFIPYIGPWISAVLPIGLAVGAFPDWGPAVRTVALFLVVELISNNVLEPWLHGTRTGLSPLAVVVSAFFWTWLWGLPGLFLATPLTVCLVVAGCHVESFAFFRVLFGDEPALDPELRFYQRVLSLDAVETADLLREAAAKADLEAASDALVLPALRRLARDVERGDVNRERARAIRETMDEVLAELMRLPGPRQADAEESAEPAVTARVCLVTGRDDVEVLAAGWAARLLEAHGHAVRRTSRPSAWPEQTQEGARAPELVCLSAVSQACAAQARRVGRQLRLRAPGTPFFVAYWGDGPEGERAGAMLDAPSVGSFRALVAQVRGHAEKGGAVPAPARRAP